MSRSNVCRKVICYGSIWKLHLETFSGLIYKSFESPELDYKQTFDNSTGAWLVYLAIVAVIIAMFASHVMEIMIGGQLVAVLVIAFGIAPNDSVSVAC